MNDFVTLYGTDYDLSADLAVSFLAFCLGTLGLVTFVRIRRLRKIVFVAVCVRFATAVGLHLFAPYGLFSEDYWAYAWYGKRLAEYWQGHEAFPSTLVGRNGGILFFAYNATVFTWVAYAPLLLSTLNVIAGGVTVWLTYEFGRRAAAGDETAFQAAWLVALFPSLVLWSSMNLRDTWVILSNLLIMLAVLDVRDRRWLRAAALAFVGIVAVRLLRHYMVPFVLVGVVFAVLLLLSRSKAYIRFVMFLIPVVSFGAFYYLLGREDIVNGLLTDLSARRSGLAEGTGAYFRETEFRSVGDLVWFAPVGVVYFLLAPFPWDVSGVRQTITVPETLVWYFLLSRAPFGVASIGRKSPNTVWASLFFVAVFVLPYACVSGNTGTAYRHRAQVLPFLFVFISEALTRKRLGRGVPAYDLPVLSAK